MDTSTPRSIDLAKLEDESAAELATMVRELEGGAASEGQFPQRFIAKDGKQKGRRFALRFIASDGKFKSRPSGLES